jgi:TonB-dependent siderophore receptor
MMNKIIVYISILLLASTSGAKSQDPDTETDVVELDEFVVTASDLYDTLGISLDPAKAPISATGISTTLNDRQGNRTLKDAVKNSAGVNVATGNGIHDFFVVRGIDSLNGGLILVDGVLEPEATFYPMHNLRQVQILKGPGSYLFGANTLAGTVNLVRKSPVPENFADLRLGAGSHETYEARIDGGAYSEQHRTAFRLNGLYYDSDTHRDGIDQELSALNPTVLWDISDRASFRLDADFQRSDVTPDAGLPVHDSSLVKSSRSATFQEPDDFSEQDVVRLLGTIRYSIDDDVTLRNKTYYTGLDWDSQGTVFAGFFFADAGFEPTPMTLSRFRPTLKDEQEIYGNELELTLKLDTGSVSHDLLLGGEILRFTDKFVIGIPPGEDINVDTGVRTPSPFLEALPTNAGDTETDLLGLYVLDGVEFSERWYGLAGVRLDWLDFKDDSRSTSRSDTEFSPFGGVVYQATEPVSLFANAGRGYGLPSTQVIGPRGKPEESVQVEGGAKWQTPDGRWSGQISGFYIERENIAIPDSSGLFTDNGAQESVGIDLEATGEIMPDLSLRFAYGYLDSELTDFNEFTSTGVANRSGNSAPFAPDHIGVVWAEYSFLPDWMAALGVRAVSDQFIAPDNRFEIDGYATVDASITYDKSSWYAAIYVRNLTDEDVLTRGQGATSVIPEDGISIFGHVGIRI